MDPITWTAIAVVIGVGAGFGAGWGLKPDASVKVLEAQTESIEALTAGQNELLENATKPIVIDAELKATLAEIPVQCLKEYGGDPTTVQCQWATCLQFGQSSAQRPECGDVKDLMIKVLAGNACTERPE